MVALAAHLEAAPRDPLEVDAVRRDHGREVVPPVGAGYQWGTTGGAGYGEVQGKSPLSQGEDGETVSDNPPGKVAARV